MAVRMWPQHLLHPLTGAQSDVTCRVEFSVSAAQDFLRRFMTVVPFHGGEPVEEKSCQRQSVASRSLSGNMTQSTFRQCKDNLRLESSHCFFQRFIARQRPNQIFIVADPRR